ncbi:hypothetical protein Tco_0408675 [Tanacetum coccineum]
MPRECLRIIESKSKVRNSWNKAVVAKMSLNSSTPRISLTTEVSELKNMIKTMLIDKQKAQAPAPINAVEQSCVTCGGAHSYRNCSATDGNGQGLQNQMTNLTDMLSKFVNANTASSSGTGSLPKYTLQPEGGLERYYHRSGIAYKGPTIPTHLLLLKKPTTFLAIEDDPYLIGSLIQRYLDPVGEGRIFLSYDEILNSVPSPPPPIKEAICQKFKKILKFVKQTMKNFQLMSLPSTPWFADFATTMRGNFIVKKSHHSRKIKFFKDVKKHNFGMTGGVCTVKKLLDILEALHNGPTGGHHAYCAKSHRLKRYGYIKNYKKTVKNGQARTRESEESTKEAKDSKPKPEKSSLSQNLNPKWSKHWSTKVNQ